MADARDTKKQENGSRLFFESVIEKGKEPTIQYIEKNAYEDMPATWFTFYQLQAQALKKYLGNNKGYTYSRDKGIMPFIEKLAAQKMGVSTKDRWNPMDIIMVKTNKEDTIKKKIQKIADLSVPEDEKLIQLNIYMAELLTKKDMIPISLKGLTKTAKEAKLEEANMGENKTVEFKLKPQSLKCDLDMTNPPLFDTGEFSFRFFADKDEIGVQIRSFRYSKPTTGPQTDLTPKGGGAKLGKVSTKAIEPFLADIGLERPLSVVQDPMISTDGHFSSTQINFWVDFYNKIKDYKIDGQKVDWDFPFELGDKKSSFEKNLKHGLKNCGKDRNALGRITSKLFTLRYIEIYYKISQKQKFKEWLSTLYYGAKKEFSNLNGPFIKIY
jgi:hypothetical protein